MCEEEIVWAEVCIKEMAEKDNYCDDDKVWLPCHLKAYQTIREALKGLGKEPCYICKGIGQHELFYSRGRQENKS